MTHGNQNGILVTGIKQVFRVEKTRGAPMGRPKFELLASNDVHIRHAI